MMGWYNKDKSEMLKQFKERWERYVTGRSKVMGRRNNINKNGKE